MLPEQFSQWADIFPQALALVTRDGLIQVANRRFLDLLRPEPGGSLARSLKSMSSHLPRKCWHGLAYAREAANLYSERSNSSPGESKRKEAIIGSKAPMFSPAGASHRPSFPPHPSEYRQSIHRTHPSNRRPPSRNESPKGCQKELDKQQRWLQVTLSSISDAVIATDTAGRVVFLNPTASALTGWTSVDAIGQELESIFTIVNEETRLPVRSPVHRTLEEGIITGLANHTVLISRTGVSVAIDDGAAPIRDEDGQIRGVVLVFHEVTNQRNWSGHY